MGLPVVACAFALGDHIWSVQTRASVLTAISALITQAAPDVHSDDRWLLEDPQRILQLLQQQHEQLMSAERAELGYAQQQQQQQQLDNLVRHTIQQLHRLLYETTLQPNERLAAVQEVAAAVQVGMIAHVERLVAGEYILRERWLADTYKLQNQHRQHEQQQQQHFPWLAAVRADAAAGSCPSSKQVSLRMQQWQQDHCMKLKTSKAETLAVLYGLQLQAGCVTWQQMEQQLTAPAGSLDRLLLHYKSPMLRKLVLYVCAQVVLVAPSLLCQQQQQQQTGLRVAAHYAPSASSPFPSDWLLRLWLRGNFDCTNSGTRLVLWHATKVLSGNPATMSLFSGLPLTLDVAQQLSVPHHCGMVCANMLRVVCGRVAAAGGPHRLLELLRGLDQVWRMSCTARHTKCTSVEL
jgi:hypothetical protein